MDLQNIERRIFFYYYPRFSEFMKYFLILFVLIFDASHFLSYIIGFLIIILVLYNEELDREKKTSHSGRVTQSHA
jgi:hypothetical protein